jgi:ribonuclease R
VVVELGRRGRLVTGEPYFEPGVPLTIDRRGLADGAPGDLAVVRASRGRAQIEHLLGPAARIETVLEALLHDRGEVADHEPHDPPAATTEGRVDLRELPTVTIDPDTAKDFDDAISVQRDGDALRVFVHIADVSHFVPAGTPLDLGSAERALSVYVPGRVAPMLPHPLADDLCSLRPHEDRLTLTVEVPFDNGGASGEPSFYRSVIRSDARLTYAEAESILAGRASADDDVTDTLRPPTFVRAASRAGLFASSPRRSRSLSTATAESSARGSSASRTPTLSWRSS